MVAITAPSLPLEIIFSKEVIKFIEDNDLLTNNKWKTSEIFANFLKQHTRPNSSFYIGVAYEYGTSCIEKGVELRKYSTQDNYELCVVSFPLGENEVWSIDFKKLEIFKVNDEKQLVISWMYSCN